MVVLFVGFANILIPMLPPGFPIRLDLLSRPAQVPEGVLHRQQLEFVCLSFNFGF